MTPRTQVSLGNIRPLARQNIIQVIEDDLSFLEQEIQFYLNLIRIGLQNCSVHIKEELFSLHSELSNYKDSIIPEFNKRVGTFKEAYEIDGEKLSTFMLRLESFSMEVRRLKSRFFPFFPTLIHFTIL